MHNVAIVSGSYYLRTGSYYDDIMEHLCINYMTIFLAHHVTTCMSIAIAKYSLVWPDRFFRFSLR